MEPPERDIISELESKISSLESEIVFIKLYLRETGQFIFLEVLNNVNQSLELINKRSRGRK